MQIQYKAPRNWLQTLLQTEIAQGMALTLRRMFNRPITRQYPEEKPVVAAGFRGRHALVRDAATGDSRCVACMRCARVCPSHCIRIRWSRAQDNSRVVQAYNIDALRCIFCGYCEVACPFDAITMSHEYELAVTDRSGLMEYLIVDVEAATNARHKSEKEAAAPVETAPAVGGEADE